MDPKSARDANWRPQLLDPEQQADELAALMEATPPPQVRDLLPRQLRELCEVRRPQEDWTPRRFAEAVEAHLQGRSPDRYGVWVHYPWRQTLVHLLPPAEFREVRYDRNRHKITREEQDRLRQATIGVVGLSVGRSILTTLVLEGIGGRFRLADPDGVALSNLNRLPVGLPELGMSKAVLAARQVLELDPFLEVELFEQGVEEHLLDRFLGGPPRLDLVFEECDDLYLKVRLREKAREHALPVVMCTDDRGMVDVERYDLDPNRPVFHDLLGGVEAAHLAGLSTRDKVPYVLRILGDSGLSSRLVASLLEVGETLVSFPQLGSEATLGGALGAHVARRLLLGEMRASGRFFVDLDRLVCDGSAVELAPEAPLEVEVSPLAVDAPSLPSGSSPSAAERAQALVAWGIRAPSGGNSQPWRFRARDDTTLDCFVDRSRTGTFLDYGELAPHLVMGSAVENMVLAGPVLGTGVEVAYRPDLHEPDLVARLHLEPLRAGPRAGSVLAHHVAGRVTNRQLVERRPLRAKHRRALEAAARGGRLHWVEDPEALAELGDVLGIGDRLRLQHRRMHREMMSEIRWTREQAERTRDGLDLATVELSASDAAAFRLLRSWRALQMLSRVGMGSALEKLSRDYVESASALALLTLEGTDGETFFRGGRILQRLWLQATALGLGFHPLTAINFVFHRLEWGGGDGLEPAQHRAFRELRERYRQVFRLPPDTAEILLFRLFEGPPPTARALRRPVSEVLEVAPEVSGDPEPQDPAPQDGE